jgi:nitrogen fixation/metabolism regulation signal transduction histidine kinase
MTFALVAMGIVCVGASGYLVQLAAAYFEEIGDAQVETQRELVDIAQPFYEEMASAKVQAFEARSETYALRFAAERPLNVQSWAQALVDENRDVQGLRVRQPGRTDVIVGSIGSAGAETTEAPVTHEVLKRAPITGGGTLEVSFGVEPGLAADYQRLGVIKRDLGKIDLAGEGAVEQEEVARAVVVSLSVASGMVLFAAIVAGLIIGRQTTRKVSDISEVMRRVAQGDFGARAPRLGNDELGQLAAAFNGMLDELEQARETVGYLQRIGAWQDMARRIAHEIKNPLTPIQLAVQQIREKDPGHSEAFSRLLEDSVEIVEDEVEALRRMVTSFSQFAKVPEVKLEVVELERVLDEFERAYGHLSDRDEDELEILRPRDAAPARGRRGEPAMPAPTRVMADRQLLKQVLVNLVENAVLSAREAGIDPVRVRVAAVRLGARVEVRVEDNGPGVPRELRDRLFEPYETTREHGTGLGLAIVKKIVLDHGGEISLDETELGGAAFVIRLPVLGS